MLGSALSQSGGAIVGQGAAGGDRKDVRLLVCPPMTTATAATHYGTESPTTKANNIISTQ